MKKNLLIAAITVIASIIFIGCEQFPASYQRIEESSLRLLNFMYEPADASPGDTVTLTAVFAGKTADLESDLEWWISFNVITDMFGGQTVVDSMPLTRAAHDVSIVSFSPNTQAIAFKFKIPEDIVKTSASIPEIWTNMLPPNLQNTIPAQFASMTKNEIADILYSAPQAFADNPYLPFLLQFFTVPLRITVKHELGKLPHTINSSHSIRYNRRFHSKGNWDVPINQNPVIDSIAVSVLRGKELMTFDEKLVEKTFRLDISDPVIEVRDGYSYFIEASTNNKDWTTTMDGGRIEEKHRAYWQFQLDPAEARNVHHTDYPDFGAIMGAQWSLRPPKDKRITKFTFWVTVKDEALNERMRPAGSALAEVSGRFEYK
ncbi:MAG: hypothetical protein FWE57_04505 [Chitinispirillia bacterium]|nr:hypothetical protein [Chitinispirillia bacterium]